MPPTFGVPHGLVVGLIAGGPGALLKAVEGAEDSQQAGEDDLVALNLQEQDLVVGLAASGRTPYVIGGLRYARQSVVPLLPSPVIQIRLLRGRLISLFRPLSGRKRLPAPRG